MSCPEANTREKVGTWIVEDDRTDHLVALAGQ